LLSPGKLFDYKNLCHWPAFSLQETRKRQSPAFHQLSLMNESSQFRSWVGYTMSTEERPERFNSEVEQLEEIVY
jgi:hypothetical protein